MQGDYLRLEILDGVSEESDGKMILGIRVQAAQIAQVAFDFSTSGAHVEYPRPVVQT
jgi:hypothetical protein